MSSPQIVSSNIGNYVVGALTGTTVTSGTTPTVGNVILAAMMIIGTLVDPGTIISPVGWELVHQNLTGAGSTTRVAVFAKIAGIESGSYDFSWSNISAIGFWLFAEYGNCDPGDAIDGTGAGIQNSLGINSVAPSIDPSFSNSFNTLICVWAAQLSIGNIMSVSPPNGMTLRVQSNLGLISFPSLMLADVYLSSNASTGAKTATSSFATPSLGISLLIKQAVEAPLSPTGNSGGM